MTLPCAAAVCLYLSLFYTVHGVDDDIGALRHLENRIFDLIESPLRYYLYSVDGDRVDVNLMLGVSIMKGQLMSCTDNYHGGLGRKRILLRMIGELHSKFYKNNLTDLKTTGKILDYHLWTSPSEIIHKSHDKIHSTLLDADLIVNGNQYYRNISDKCIFQVISTCHISPECVAMEFADGFFGYALTHQVLYSHILKKMKCGNSIFEKVTEKTIRNKCSKIYDEALYIADNFVTLHKFKDLFIEQIAICGMQNMMEFIRPEWLAIVSAENCFDYAQQKNNDSCYDPHFTGVSLAAFGVYWKFLCYKINTHGTY